MSGPTRLRRRFVPLALLVIAALLAAGVGEAVLVQRQGGEAPADRDFIAVEQVPRQPTPPASTTDASTGLFVSPCGRNENAHRNTDNVITAPGEVGGAHHVHEYVGNVLTDAFSTDRSLVAAGTTCRNGDASTYYWPVLRWLRTDRRTRHDAAVHEPTGVAGGHPNPEAPVAPASVLVQFRGNPATKVVAMPRFLRLSTGNANAATAPPGTAQWSCTGSPDRRTPLYPLCPAGQHVLRIFDFPSCWDGRRTDSPNHRAHAVFPAPNGVCPRDTFPIPQLHLEVAYPVPPGRSFAIDAFPDQRRHPTTDHAHFINVMPDPLMSRVVACLNGGRRC